ncbi:hypothetical protein OHA98_39275 [Streptomyces sp. NBC_00654]|uniref:hypothetical protein n=1 Tax=Streptomyces sp. NBC_00654 TaxID=2975799 RepID=UPI002257B9C6|nr:hypothetical protein [Streptomyces sp. NBC_00654]MCX4970695.1 hypothetical protein [Streptomyces sp. NBC_00654]
MPLPDGELDLLLADVELSLSAHGRDRIAVVWPRGADLLARIVAGRRTAPALADSNRGPSARAVAARLADRLADRLGEPVTAAWRMLTGQAPGGPEVVYRTEWDTLLLSVRGALWVRVAPFDAGGDDSTAAAGRRPGPLRLRLRTGEAVYVPRGFMCEMSEVRKPTLLLELSLPGTG